MAQDFDLGDILSITTGLLVSPRKMEGVYDILNFMTGHNLYTHQLPAAARLCRPYLAVQHPALAAITSESAKRDWNGDTTAVDAWLEAQKAIYGATLPVEPLANDTVPGAFADPIGQLAKMVGTERMIVVEVPT